MNGIQLRQFMNSYVFVCFTHVITEAGKWCLNFKVYCSTLFFAKLINHASKTFRNCLMVIANLKCELICLSVFETDWNVFFLRRHNEIKLSRRKLTRENDLGGFLIANKWKSTLPPNKFNCLVCLVWSI